MSLLNRIRSAVHEFTKPDAKPVEFRWHDYPDPLTCYRVLPDGTEQAVEKRVHECPLPDGGSILAQEVSAPDFIGGAWGWQILNDEGEVLEMRNGFKTVEATKEHAQAHYLSAYLGGGESAGTAAT